MTDAFALLLDLIAGRYQANAGKSLWDVYNLDPAFVTVDPGAAALIYYHRADLIVLLEQPEPCARLVDFFIRATLAFTFRQNQFIYVNKQEENRLRSLYGDYLAQIRETLIASASAGSFTVSLNEVIRQHFGRLRANLARFFAPLEGQPTEQDIVKQNHLFTRVICGEYSPAFQMEMLGLQIDDLVEPVLDLGCGPSGALVSYLNQRGIAARGVDRSVQLSPYLTRADWLEYQPGSSAWGTIISHMAFSNHFIFQHRYQYGQPEPYARQYIALLGALKPGGSFYYTPGLPFIEQYLDPSRYQLCQRPTSLEQPTPGEYLYAAQVTRL